MGATQHAAGVTAQEIGIGVWRGVSVEAHAKSFSHGIGRSRYGISE
jgi:hypothetical protein